MELSRFEDLRFELTITRNSDRKNVELKQDLFADQSDLATELDRAVTELGIEYDEEKRMYCDKSGDTYALLIREYDVNRKRYTHPNRYALSDIGRDCTGLFDRYFIFESDYILPAKDVTDIKNSLSKKRQELIEKIEMTEKHFRYAYSTKTTYTVYFKNGEFAYFDFKKELPELCDRIGSLPVKGVA